MKPLTTCILSVRIKDLDNSLVEKIDFIFRTSKNRYSRLILKKKWNEQSSDVTHDEKNNTYNISFKTDETELFASDSEFWLDIRPVLKDGSVPEVGILRKHVSPTLFTRSDIDDT